MMEAPRGINFLIKLQKTQTCMILMHACIECEKCGNMVLNEFGSAHTFTPLMPNFSQIAYYYTLEYLGMSMHTWDNVDLPRVNRHVHETIRSKNFVLTSCDESSLYFILRHSPTSECTQTNTQRRKENKWMSLASTQKTPNVHRQSWCLCWNGKAKGRHK